MSDTVIKVENLGKKYIIGHQQERHTTIRDALADKFKYLKSKLGSSSVKKKTTAVGKDKEFWALRDVYFEINEGEVVGIVGHNGAGKSTLLKILSRITEPTMGKVNIRGRVASLLEVGTGFHPELTGRENIFLNGAILGMGRKEINKKFSEIVAFAEVERFIDTPVKRYSSGMYVRLAFAVAAHLDPEILLIDEVLAVGDIEFQKKCIGKMENVAGSGRTVIVVSHNMSTVKALCSQALLLEKGRIKEWGLVDQVVSKYLSANKKDPAEKIITEEQHIMGGKRVKVKKIRLLNNVNNSFSVYWKQPISVEVEIEVIQKTEQVSIGSGIRMLDGTAIFFVHHDDYSMSERWMFEPGNYLIRFTLENNLKPGIYILCVGGHQEHYLKNLFHVEAVNLEVLDHTSEGLTPLIYNPGQIVGESSWEVPERKLTGYKK